MSPTDESVDVAVIGGGPAGLAHAFWRRRRDPNLRIVVFERADRVGGHVRSRVVDGCHCEWGPQGIRPSPAFASLVAALGCSDLLIDASPAASQRWVGRSGRLFRVPNGPGAFLRSGMLSVWSRLRALREPWVRPVVPALNGDPETLADFVRRRFGAALVPLADAMVGGIFASSAHTLEVRSAFPALVELEREHGSVLRGLLRLAKRRRAGRDATVVPKPRAPILQTFLGGMQVLADRLGAVAEVRTGESGRIERVRPDPSRGWQLDLESGRALRALEVVIATPAHVAAKLLHGVDAELGQSLTEIPTVDIACVHVRAPRIASVVEQRGFGFLLVPGSVVSSVLGVIYVSEVFPNHAPASESLFRVMLGGARDPEILGYQDAQLESVALDALRTHAAVEAPRVVAIDRVPRAIPQYVSGHAERVAQIRSRVAQIGPGLSLIGNSYDGISLGDQLGDPFGAKTTEVRR